MDTFNFWILRLFKSFILTSINAN